MGKWRQLVSVTRTRGRRVATPSLLGGHSSTTSCRSGPGDRYGKIAYTREREAGTFRLVTATIV